MSKKEKVVEPVMNVPVVSSDFTNLEFAKEAQKRSKTIKAEMKKINSCFEKIAFNLHWFFMNNAYSQLGYKNVYEFAMKEYGISRGTTNNFINVVERFSVRDEKGDIVERIRPELEDFQSSKLITLLAVDDSEIGEFSSDMSVREMKSKIKEMHEESSDGDCPASSETDEQDIDDIPISISEVNRQLVISFSNIGEYNAYLDSMNDLIEKNLKSKAFKDGSKKIEVSIVW